MPMHERKTWFSVADSGELLEQLGLAERALGQARERERLLAADRRGHRGVGQLVQGREAELREHLVDVVVAGADVAAGEGVRGLEKSGISRQTGLLNGTGARCFNGVPTWLAAVAVSL